MTHDEAKSRAAMIVQDHYAKRAWGYDPNQHAEYEQLIAAAILAAARDGERLEANLKDTESRLAIAVKQRELCDYAIRDRDKRLADLERVVRGLVAASRHTITNCVCGGSGLVEGTHYADDDEGPLERCGACSLHRAAIAEASAVDVGPVT